MSSLPEPAAEDTAEPSRDTSAGAVETPPVEELSTSTDEVAASTSDSADAVEGLSASTDEVAASTPDSADAVEESSASTDEVAASTSDSADAVEAEPPSQHPLVRDLMLNPSRWRIWPAVAVLRWLQRLMQSNAPKIVFRSHPSLSFAGSEVRDIVFKEDQIDIVLNAPGLAAAGSPLPTSDIARIIADYYENGALSAWLDGPGDRFMHLLEEVQMRTDPAYALLTGGQMEAFALARDLVGRSVPLNAKRGAELHDSDTTQPEGAVALAGLFLGPVSAAGLRGIFGALTGLTVRTNEFTGAEIDIARPARIGEPMGLMLGTSCHLPAAGVEIHIEGSNRPEAQAWAREATRRASLHLLATAYIGAPSPSARVYLWLDGGNVPAAALDNETALGGLAVLGGSNVPVALPLAT